MTFSQQLHRYRFPSVFFSNESDEILIKDSAAAVFFCWFFSFCGAGNEDESSAAAKEAAEEAAEEEAAEAAAEAAATALPSAVIEVRS